MVELIFEVLIGLVGVVGVLMFTIIIIVLFSISFYLVTGKDTFGIINRMNGK